MNSYLVIQYLKKKFFSKSFIFSEFLKTLRSNSKKKSIELMSLKLHLLFVLSSIDIMIRVRQIRSIDFHKNAVLTGSLFFRTNRFVYIFTLAILNFIKISAPQTVFQVERFQEPLVTDTVTFKGKCISYKTCDNADAFGLSSNDPCQCRCKDSTMVSSSANKCIPITTTEGSPFSIAKIDQVSPSQLVTKFTTAELTQGENYIYSCLDNVSCSRNITDCTINYKKSFYDGLGWHRIWEKKDDVDFSIDKNNFGTTIKFNTVQCAMDKYSGMLLKLALQCYLNTQVLIGYAMLVVIGSYEIGKTPADRVSCSTSPTPLILDTIPISAIINNSSATTPIVTTNPSTIINNSSASPPIVTTDPSASNPIVTKIETPTNTFTVQITAIIETPPSPLNIKSNDDTNSTALISAIVVLALVLLGSCIIITFLYRRWRRKKSSSANITSAPRLSFEQITYPHPVFFIKGGSIYQNGGLAVSAETNASTYDLPMSESEDNSIKSSRLDKVFSSFDKIISHLHYKKTGEISFEDDYDYRKFIDPLSYEQCEDSSVNQFDDLDYNIPEETDKITPSCPKSMQKVDTKSLLDNSGSNQNVGSAFETFKFQKSIYTKKGAENISYSVPDNIDKNPTPVLLVHTQSGYMRPFCRSKINENNGEPFYDFPESIELVQKDNKITSPQYENLGTTGALKKLNSFEKIGNFPLKEHGYYRKTTNDKGHRREESIYSEPEHDDSLIYVNDYKGQDITEPKNDDCLYNAGRLEETMYAVPEQDDSLAIEEIYDDIIVPVP